MSHIMLDCVFRSCSHTHIYLFMYYFYCLEFYFLSVNYFSFYVKHFELRKETALYINKFIIIISSQFVVVRSPLTDIVVFPGSH